jgi:plastocyanin
MAGNEEWTFKALKEGTSAIFMGYSRPWESTPPVETFGLTVVVKPIPTPMPTPAHANVDISGFAFVPSTLTVSVGTTVTWTNKDSVSHTVTSNDNLFDSGTLAKGATFEHTFNQKGTFGYHCSIHPSMTAKVIVE